MAKIIVNNLSSKNVEVTEDSKAMLEMSEEDVKGIKGGITAFSSVSINVDQLAVAWCCCSGQLQLNNFLA